ncbi:MAG: hypothetical protein ACPGU1_05745 [Myxococcota bacterium]
MITTHNDALIQRYGTFLVAPPDSRKLADTAPFGLEVTWHIDPLRAASGTFLDLLQTLDGLTFGPEGMPMDKWVFYDCSELPGFIYGFATPADELSADERTLFGVPDGYTGPVPLSMYIAIPMIEQGAWFGHNLASLNRVLPHRDLHHMGTITKALALKCYRVERFVGATQWTSKALYIHTKFGPLDLLTTYTPAHSIHETLTYAFDVTDNALRTAFGDPSASLKRPEPDRHLASDDVAQMKAMQAALESGERFVLCGAAHQDGERLMHPIVAST